MKFVLPWVATLSDQGSQIGLVAKYLDVAVDKVPRVADIEGEV